MPIDSTKTPSSPRQRYAVAILLTVLVVLAGYFVYMKDLRHHSTVSSPTSTPSVVQTVPKSKAPTVTTTTTIPGGVAISTRNPFGS
jgi:hypothetical protein